MRPFPEDEESLVRCIFQGNEKSLPLFCISLCLVSFSAHYLNYYSNFAPSTEQYSYFNYLRENVLGIVLLLTFFGGLFVLASFYSIYFFLLRRYPFAFIQGYSGAKLNLLYGFVQIVQWQPNYGLVIKEKNQITRIFQDGRGGNYIIYPLKQQSTALPIYLGSRLLEGNTTISIEAERNYVVQLLVVWKINDLRMFYNSLLQRNQKATEDDTINAVETLIINLVEVEISKLARVILSTSKRKLENEINNNLSEGNSYINRMIENSNSQVLKKYGSSIEVISFRIDDLQTVLLTRIGEKVSSEVEDLLNLFTSGDLNAFFIKLDKLDREGLMRKGILDGAKIYPPLEK